MQTAEQTDIRRAWETLRDAVNSRDECPDWETCSPAQLQRAEQRQVAALRWLQNVGVYLGVVQ